MWQPIETCPPETKVLVYAPDNEYGPYIVDSYCWITEVNQETTSESRNAKGRRYTVQEVETRRRDWQISWGAEFWQHLPEPPILLG